MSNYNIGLQEAKGGYKVVLYSRTGKLVLAGEIIKRHVDAVATMNSIEVAWNNSGSTLTPRGVMPIPRTHKWPGNAGPKKVAKKAPAKKAKKK